MNRLKKLLTLLIFSAVVMSIPFKAEAQISVDGVLVHMPFNQRPVHNVVVGNSSNDPAYVVVNVDEFPDPNKPEHTVPTTDLLASPKAFSIEANGTRTVRLLLKSAPKEKERVFRVTFTPQDKGFGQEIQKNVGGFSTVLRVLTGMGILVFTDPAAPHADLKWERLSDKIVFTNSGNVHISLSEGESCTKPAEGAKSAENCTKLGSKRIYGESSFEFKVPSNTTVTFLKNETSSGDFERLTIPPVIH